jgi:glyoxylase-like metal-dependent hydrolase (beta-lactamase superfamily II)
MNDYLYHVDLKEFGVPRVLSSFIAEFDDGVVFLDCGTSLEIDKLLKFARTQNIDLSNVRYLIPSHHHFDHAGGMWKLYQQIKKTSPDVKILTNEKTMELLNDYEFHLNRAKRTFGNFIGDMEKIEEKAFRLITPTESVEKLHMPESQIDIFHLNGSEIQLKIIKSPGHTPDHQCPLFMKENIIDFIFFGEAVGTIYHSSELVTMPTSMPVFYNHDSYMETLQKFKKIEAVMAGFCHFGVVKGEENVKYILNEHEVFIQTFRNKIIQFYQEKPKTRHIVNQIMPYLTERTDLVGEEHPVMKNIVLGVVYGMMMDLGYRND